MIRHRAGKQGNRSHSTGHPKRLSYIVHKFLLRWLLFSIAGLIVIVSIWGAYQFHFVRTNQTHNARALADHVDSYLSECNTDLKYASSFFMGPASDISNLRTFLQGNSNFQQVYILNYLGNTIRSVPKEAGPSDFSGFIKSSSVQEKFYLTSPYYSSDKKKLVVSMLRNLSRDRMILAELNLEVLNKSVSSLTQHMRSGFGILTDKNGDIIAHPDISKLDEHISKNDLETYIFTSEGLTESGVYKSENGLQLVSTTRTSLGRWQVFVGQDLITLFQPVLTVMFFSLLGLILLFSLLAHFFQRRLHKNVVDPLSNFIKSVRAMKRGDYSYTLDKNKNKNSDRFLELQNLQGEFDQMQNTIHQRQMELQENERKLQTLMNNLPGMAYRCYNTPEWIMDFVSEGCVELLGYSAEELLSSEMIQYSDFVHPEDAPRVWKQVQEGVRNDRPFRVEYRIFTRQGEEKWVWEQGQAVVTAFDGTQVLEGFVTDITERKNYQERLNFLSFHDSLTGLYNRNFFEEEMRRLQDGRYAPIGIIVCDLNGLKLVNDTLGHESGDELLASAAALIKENLRSSDIVARIGGDEFAILLTEVDQDQVQKLVQRLREAVSEYNSNEPKIYLTLSIGYALSSGEFQDPQALFREADNRMYREKIQQGESAHSSIVQALMKALEARDFITEGHSDRLQELALSLAQRLELSHETQNDLKLLARFHDLGKVGIPDRILFKQGPLDEEEAREMRKHPEIGHRIAQSVPQLAHLADWILKHHEHWDGRGYPMGLREQDIPLPCRVLAIADAYDAMTSDRPYRSALSHDEAIAELRRNEGIQFDPELVELFIKVMVSDTEALTGGSPL